MIGKNSVKIIESDTLSYEKVSVFLSDNLLNISPLDRSDISFQAKASFTFYCINEFFLTVAIRDSKKQRLVFEFSGDFLGEMDEYSGYLAVSEGRNIHPVELLKLEISFISSCQFEFNLSGKVGSIYPWGCANPNYLDRKFNFEINFALDENKTKSIIDRAKKSASIVTDSDLWKKFDL
jgi:hypothetical protein